MLARDEEKAKEEILKEFFKTILKFKLKDYVSPASICHDFFMNSFMGACSKLNSFEELLESCFKRIDEYTDRYSDDLPDFYLRSKVDGVPDLAIELKTSKWVYSPDLKKEYSLVIKDIKFLIKAGIKIGKILSPLLPKELVKPWSELESELENIKYALDKAIIVEENINKEEWLRQNIRKFLEEYFFARTGKFPIIKMEDDYTFVVNFNWESQENQRCFEDFLCVGKIEKFFKRSKKKFENLRKLKSDKLDKNHHLELLLVEATFIAVEDFEDYVKQVYEKLVQKGYNYPIHLVADSDNSLNRYFIICMR